MAQQRVTKKWLKNHWHYCWWKYVLLAFICVVSVNMVFTMTAYRPPEEKKIEVFMLSGYCDAVALERELAPLFLERYPEQELLTVSNINLSGGDMYAAMQFSTYAAAQQGDVCLMPESEMIKLTAEGADHAFLELSPYIESGVLNVGNADMTRGVFAASTGETGVYAVPADTLYGLERYGCNPADSYLCIMDYSGNSDHAAAVLSMMIELYQTERPAGEAEAPREQTMLF